MDGKGTVLFWQLSNSKVSFAQCTDDPGFRTQFKPWPDGSFFPYALDASGKTANAQSCTAKDPATCHDSPGLTFSVTGNALFLSQDLLQTITNSTCQVKTSLSWEIDDAGPTIKLAINQVFSLVGDATACGQVESQQKQLSPNHLGYQGCLVALTADGAYSP